MTEPVIRGALDAVPLLDAFSVLARYRKSGVLTLRTLVDEMSIVFERGSVRSVSTNIDALRIGQVLIQLGHVTEEQIEQALALQSVASDPDRIGDVLVDIGFISEAEISQAIARQIQSALVNLLRHQDGEFAFVPRKPADTSQLSSKISFEPLVLNATYLADRWLAEQEPKHVDTLPETLIDPRILQRLNSSERNLLQKLLETYSQLHQLAWRYGQAARQVKLSVERLLQHVLVRWKHGPDIEADHGEDQPTPVEHYVYLVDRRIDLWSLSDLTRNARSLLLHLLNGEIRLSALESNLSSLTINPERAVQELVSKGLIRIDLVVGDTSARGGESPARMRPHRRSAQTK